MHAVWGKHSVVARVKVVLDRNILQFSSEVNVSWNVRSVRLYSVVREQRA